jgi:hypothetical protein
MVFKSRDDNPMRGPSLQHEGMIKDLAASIKLLGDLNLILLEKLYPTKCMVTRDSDDTDGGAGGGGAGGGGPGGGAGGGGPGGGGKMYL